MGRDELEVINTGVVKRRVKRRVGLFIDATGLDRATRRLERKVDLSKLVTGLVSGLQLEVARYYTLIPFEDDARQLSFLDAVERAGVEVTTKRLPPKGVKRQVSMDVHIASDIINFTHGHFAQVQQTQQQAAANDIASGGAIATSSETPGATRGSNQIKRIAIVVCPSREVSYALYTCSELGAETVLADFGLYGSSDGWKGVDRWIDLSTSETIWR